MKKMFLIICLSAAALIGVDAVQAQSLADFWDGKVIVLRADFASQTLTTTNRRDEVSFNGLALGGDFYSGYAWGVVGFDLAGGGTLASGRGQSEMSRYDYESDVDKSKAVLTTAAPKLRFGTEEWGIMARGGFTRLDVGTIGSSWRMHSHAYRGFEVKGAYKAFELGYAWADRFLNEWDYMYRDITTNFLQNRNPFGKVGKDVDYIHSIGVRYEFSEGLGYVDAGYGEGKDFRTNAQLAAGIPFETGMGVITVAGYGFWGKFNDKLWDVKARDPKDEYHFSGAVYLDRKEMSAMIAYADTHAPDHGELCFSLSIYSNADKRSFSPVRSQRDEHAWHGEKIVAASFNYDLGTFGLTGVYIGGRASYSWNLKVEGRGARGTMTDIEYYVEYSVPEGPLQGLTVGIHPAHLRSQDFYMVKPYGGSYGKQSQDDIQIAVSYSYVIGGGGW